ncbi:uncharacterized protein LOC143019038 [Oratosquilla oratoria]|uniref:uncharacterized protein LOC143019038 n=1 Tax=Oratosquilla oratoria TaxID=337810 RepID=UPI003F76B0CB
MDLNWNHDITRITFVREIEALRALVHPNIVRLADVAPDDVRCTIIITEYYLGGPLLDLMQRHASSHSRDWSRWVKTFLMQLVAAVAFMHERHFGHLDIESNNIDFGLPVRSSDLYDRNIGGVLGILLYMAPEVQDRTQHPYAGGKADV